MPDRLAKTLVDAAMELHRRRLWAEVPADSPFLIRLSDEEVLVATLIGQALSNYGLMLLRGEGAFRWQLRMIEEDRNPAFEGEWDVLSVTFDPLASIPEDYRAPLRAAGFAARPEQAAPLFFAKEGSRKLRPISRDEMTTVAACLTGILAADNSGQLRAVILDKSKQTVLDIRVDGSRVETRRSPWPRETPLVPPILDLPGSFDDLPRLDERWIAAVESVPAEFEDDDRSVRAFVLADEESELVLASEIVLGDDLRPAAAKLAAVFRGDNALGKSGLPREIAFSRPLLHDAFASALAAIGVRAILGDEPEP